MRHQDFGHFDGPVVLFGGPYSNLHAAQAMVSAFQGRAAICTGDIVAYCAAPNETVDTIRESGCFSVAGNCEEQLASGAQDCGCGFDDGSACDLLSRGWYPFAVAQTTTENVAWLGTLPEIGTFVQNDRRYAVIHGGATAINRFLWPSSDVSDFEVEISAVESAVGKIDGIVAGHCGIAFHRRCGDHQWINTGAIGLPPHDGCPETRYAVLTDGEVVIERLCYDHNGAATAMEAAGLTQGYHQALRSGLWPSEDVLPAELRR